MTLSLPVLRTDRLVLDAVGLEPDDVKRITTFCRDEQFEKYMTTPWPYTRSDAVFFATEFAPQQLANDAEITWAIRLADSREIIGCIGYRVPQAELGFWMGAPYRGHGYLPEAARTVIGHGFETYAPDRVTWRAVRGNVASARVAQKLGMTFDGTHEKSMRLRKDSDLVDEWWAYLPHEGAEPDALATWPDETRAGHSEDRSADSSVGLAGTLSASSRASDVPSGASDRTRLDGPERENRPSS